jgi:hypothetical protein
MTFTVFNTKTQKYDAHFAELLSNVVDYDVTEDEVDEMSDDYLGDTDELDELMNVDYDVDVHYNSLDLSDDCSVLAIGEIKVYNEFQITRVS